MSLPHLNDFGHTQLIICLEITKIETFWFYSWVNQPWYAHCTSQLNWLPNWLGQNFRDDSCKVGKFFDPKNAFSQTFPKKWPKWLFFKQKWDLKSIRRFFEISGNFLDIFLTSENTKVAIPTPKKYDAIPSLPMYGAFPTKVQEIFLKFGAVFLQFKEK